MFQELPLSEEYSIFILAILFDDHVILCVLPADQLSPPTGAVSVTDKAGAAVIENVDALTLLSEASVTSLIRTLHCVDILLGTFHVYVPAAADMDELMEIQLLPLLVVNSSATLATFADDHVIV